MLTVNENKICLTRGDSALFQIKAVVMGTSQYYQFQAGDKLKFTIKRRAVDSEEVVSKEVTVSQATQTVNIILEPQDTKQLSFCCYRYDVQLTKANGWVDTIVSSTEFEVGEEIG